MSLAAMQADFRKWLVDGSNDAAARFEPSAQPGLLVYQNNYRSQLVACLAEAFERVHSWLGDDAFLGSAIAHIDATPPRHWTLDAYSAGFAETLEAKYPDDPEVAELARIEWALAQAFTARGSACLAPAAISLVDWDHARIEFTPSLAMREIYTNAAAIWSALAAEETPPAAAQLPDEAALLVWRKDFTPRFRTIDKVERNAIAQIIAGESFAALCSTLVEHFGETAGVARAGALLGQWFADGLIVSTAAASITSHSILFKRSAKLP